MLINSKIEDEYKIMLIHKNLGSSFKFVTIFTIN